MSRSGANLSATYATLGHGLAGLKGLVALGRSAAVCVVGDSTGVSTTRWPYLFGQWLAQQNPTYTVRWRPFNTSTATYDQAPTVIQTGAAGDRGVTLDGATLTGLLTPANSLTNITGNIDLRARVLPSGGWAPGSGNNRTLIAKFGAGGQRVYRFQLLNSGKLYLDWTPDGSTLTGSVTSSAAVPFANGTAGWCRVTLNVNNAGNWQVTFYTSTDGATWTQLGTASNGTGTTSLFSTTSTPCEIGSRSIGQSEMFGGTIYAVQIRNGINGPIVAPVLPEQWYAATSNYNGVTVGAPVIDIWNGSWSGAAIANDLLPNVNQMCPAVGAAAVIVNDSKNEAVTDPSGWATLLDSLLSAIQTNNPGAGISLTAQNPSTAPVAQPTIDAHAQRVAQLSAYARRRGYTVIPVYKAFINSPLGLAALTNADGIHPSDASGSPLWAQTLEGIYSASPLDV